MGDQRLALIDANCDGVVDVRDATTFGDLGHGRGVATLERLALRSAQRKGPAVEAIYRGARVLV